MKNYSKEFLKELIDSNHNVIVTLKSGGVYVGSFAYGYGTHYLLTPPSINDGGIMFSRSDIKNIIYFTGLIVPKDKNGRHKFLNIIELSELINKAGYEFI